VGRFVGAEVGSDDGMGLGKKLGVDVGNSLGDADGSADGVELGDPDGVLLASFVISAEQNVVTSLRPYCPPSATMFPLYVT